MKLVRVVAPHFVAGFESDGTIIQRAAPIIKYMIGWTEDRARNYILKKGWKASIITENNPCYEPLKSIPMASSKRCSTKTVT